MVQLVEVPAGDLDELLDLEDPRCEMPRVRRQTWLWLWSRVTMSSARDPECGRPATQRVQMSCPCMTQRGWACAEHVELFRRPDARFKCLIGHDAVISFL